MKIPLLLCLLAVLITAGIYVPARLKPEVPPVAEGSREVPRPSPAAGKSARVREEPSPAVDPARQSEAVAVIQEAVVTYSPAGVAAIRPFLKDPDPAIRQAARDGLVQLGEADAVPILREAALQAQDPGEVASLREAADLLALPAWSESAEVREVVTEILEKEEP